MSHSSGGAQVSFWTVLCLAVGCPGRPTAADLPPLPPLQTLERAGAPFDTPATNAASFRGASGIWRRGVGSGLRTGTYTGATSLAGGVGVKALGSRDEHDLLGGALHYGRMLGPNWMLLGELFGAAQTSPRSEYVVGLSPILQYQFRTDTRWVPFAEAGVGLAYTSIREPDLSTGFEFLLQGGVGTHYFYAEDVAITLRFRWLHLSNGGIDSPNRGANTQMLFLGWSRFY